MADQRRSSPLRMGKYLRRSLTSRISCSFSFTTSGSTVGSRVTLGFSYRKQLTTRPARERLKLRLAHVAESRHLVRAAGMEGAALRPRLWDAGIEPAMVASLVRGSARMLGMDCSRAGVRMLGIVENVVHRPLSPRPGPGTSPPHRRPSRQSRPCRG